MAKNRILESMKDKPSSASRSRTAARGILLGLLLLGVLIVRLLLQKYISSPSVSPVLAMDDSKAELPVAPPPLPSDNAASLRIAHASLYTLPPTASLQALEGAASTALDIGDLWRAEALALAILQRVPGDRSARLVLGESLRREARFGEAQRLYLNLLQEHHDDSDAYLGLADTAFAAHRRPEAFRWLAKGVDKGAQTALSLSTLAHRYQDWKDFPKAEATARKAIQGGPGVMNAYLQLASIQVESGALDAGYQTLESILRRDPSNGLANRLLGVTLMNATFSHPDINRARSLLEKAVDINPKDQDIYRAAAIIYRQQHLYRLAAQAYDALLMLNPASLDARYGLGQVYALLGKTDLSTQQLALYKQLDARNRRYTRLSEEVTHHPTEAKSYAALARFLASSGDYAGAMTQYQIAAGLAPKEASIQTALKQFYAHFGWGLPEHKSQ